MEAEERYSLKHTKTTPRMKVVRCEPRIAESDCMWIVSLSVDSPLPFHSAHRLVSPPKLQTVAPHPNTGALICTCQGRVVESSGSTPAPCTHVALVERFRKRPNNRACTFNSPQKPHLSKSFGISDEVCSSTQKPDRCHVYRYDDLMPPPGHLVTIIIQGDRSHTPLSARRRMSL